MPNRLKPLNYFDFTGGVNLRPETFQLQENELPMLFNLEVDPRGGLNTRSSWSAVSPDPIVPAAKLWDPRNAYLHTLSDGTDVILVANRDSRDNGALIYAKTGAAAWAQVSGGIVANAVPHCADFASWGDEAWIVRGSSTSATYNGTTFAQLTASAAANWQNDYASPGATDTAPLAALVAPHMGYMFVALTTEDTVRHPNRIRWSHPNNPKRWAQPDYIDITDGGQQITALISFSDRLLIFKPDSVWALFGYDADSWNLVNISRTIGATNAQLVCRNEVAVFFVSWPHGVFGYSEKANVEELSIPIRSVFEDKQVHAGAMANAFIGWVGRRLWLSLPYQLTKYIPNVAPADSETVFVFDPATTSWTAFTGGDGCVPGPYIERIEGDTDQAQLAVARKYPYPIALDGSNEIAHDECQPGTLVDFQAALRTKWLDGGAPTWKKSWRRPDLLLRGYTSQSQVRVAVYHNFDNYNAQRSFQVTFSPDHRPTMWTPDGDSGVGGFMWGDGSKYGGSDQTSSVERGSSMGRAGAVQLSVTGLPGVAWGLNGIIFKYNPLRFR